MTAASAIDFNHLNKYVMGDDTLRDEVLSIFVEQLGMLLEKFDPAIDDYSWKNTAHTLKGAARGVGAWDVGDLCQEAETLTGDVGNKEKARKMLLEALKRKSKDVIEAAQNVVGGREEGLINV
ncbi:Hpt domain-containing protein [Hyphococcus flavus]|uniref:Hpt domain-containing protein n=1 Tax=Hyphococcus flavus TaxID=1866326 RepID=A0AAE9ZBP8_9PROT|nr:Hpt domain-containing protein [Hyphococcus flavus]WDI31186.1 Hpt domain-containing protein [Hyphococcus flavus]